jgi:hypothetical protein
MEAGVGTERLGDKQPDRGGVRKQKQAGRGRQVRYASDDRRWHMGRMKAVAGSGRAEKKGFVGREEETNRQRECGRKKHAVI